MYRVEATPQFEADLRRLDQETARRILDKVRWLAEHPEALRFPLQHMPDDLKGLHKYRIGDYRLLLWVDHDARILTLYGIGHRRQVYERLR